MTMATGKDHHWIKGKIQIYLIQTYDAPNPIQDTQRVRMCRGADVAGSGKTTLLQI